MIEQCLTTIVKELGATGLLLCGLYFILMRVGRMISSHLYVINHNTTEIANIFRVLTKKYCEK